MKILSIITGIGYGHTTRQEAILTELKSQGAEIVIAAYGNAFDYFEHKYNSLKIDGPRFPEKNSEFSEFKTFLLNLKLPYFYLKNYFKLRRLMKAFNPEIIICDFEPIGLYLRKNIPHVLVFNFDPLMYKEFAKKGLKKHYFQNKYISWVYNRAKKINAKIIIPTLEKHDSSEYNFVNPIVRPLPTESQKDLLKKLNLKSPPIIIMFGGSHFATNLLYKIQNVLHKVDDEFIVFAYKLFGESYDNIKFLSFKDNFLDYLKASKGIISQAGFQTLSESILLKKPSLIFPIPNFLEQELIASWAEKEGVSMKESKKYLSEKDLLRIIKTFIDSLPEMQKNLNKIHLQPTGAKEAAEIISNLVKQEK